KYVAVGEVNQLHDAIHHRVAQSDQSDERSVCQPDQTELHEHLHVAGCRQTRACATTRWNLTWKRREQLDEFELALIGARYPLDETTADRFDRGIAIGVERPGPERALVKILDRLAGVNQCLASFRRGLTVFEFRPVNRFQ